VSEGNAARLIVVDDEPQIRGIVVDYLGQDGYSVDGCASGEELDVALAARPADLVLLDISMPGEDGVSIARRLRARGSPGIIMVTALDDVVDRIVGLEVGADDYITKPFNLRELRARVRAVLRRAQACAEAEDSAVPDPRSSRLVSFGATRLDLDHRCLVDAGGDRQPLTAMEFDLLEVFARNPNRVMSRDRLLSAAHNRRQEPFDRAIDIRVARIRKKVEPDPAKPQVIKTVQGIGYIYVPPRA
jgi:two-component system phosphate regulon response regulator OmpR